MTVGVHIRKVYQKLKNKISCSFDEFQLSQCNVLTRNFRGIPQNDFIPPKWLKVNEQNHNDAVFNRVGNFGQNLATK